MHTHTHTPSAQVSGDWEIASEEVCLGTDALCANEVQVFNGSAVSVEGGVLRVTASDATATASGGVDGGIVADATSGLLHTMGE